MPFTSNGVDFKTLPLARKAHASVSDPTFPALIWSSVL
jgi:hypothetical protein